MLHFQLNSPGSLHYYISCSTGIHEIVPHRWSDSEFLQEAANRKIEETMKRSGYSAVEIANAINKATYEIPEKIEEPEYHD